MRTIKTASGKIIHTYQFSELDAATQEQTTSEYYAWCKSKDDYEPFITLQWCRETLSRSRDLFITSTGLTLDTLASRMTRKPFNVIKHIIYTNPELTEYETFTVFSDEQSKRILWLENSIQLVFDRNNRIRTTQDSETLTVLQAEYLHLTGNTFEPVFTV